MKLKGLNMFTGTRLFSLFNIAIMIFLAIITLYPVLYVFFASISDARMLTKHQGPILWPLGPITLEGYKLVLNNKGIILGYVNTLFYVIVGTAINVVLTSLAAYVLSRRHYYPRKWLMGFMVLTMFFSGGLIPLFFVITGLNIYDTRWAILLPGAISTYNVIIMRTFFQSLPVELEEAAIIDGANDWKVMWKVVLPLSVPVIAVIVLYYGVSHWNSWFNALVFLRDNKLFPLQLIIRDILIKNAPLQVDNPAQLVEESFTRELVKYCTIVVTTLPILFVYPFLQKYFVKGVLIGAIKD